LVDNTLFNRPPILNERFSFTAITKDNRIVLCYATVIELNIEEKLQSGGVRYNTGFKIKGTADVDLITDIQEKERATSAEEALAARVKDIEDNKADYATKTEVGTAEKNAKDYADSLAGNYDAAGGAEDALTAAKAYTDEIKAGINETITKITGGYEVEGNSLYELDQKISDINETISGFSYVEQEEFDVAIGNCVDNDSFSGTISSITGGAGGETTLASLQDAINNINSEEGGILTQAKAYTDELANGAVKTNAEAIASETTDREAADNNLSQRLTTAEGYVDNLNLTTQNMNAAITGHTQSISDLS
jgi:hypothetical protein